MSSNSSSSHTIFIDDADTSKVQYQAIQLGPYRGKGFIPYLGVSTDDKAGPIYDGTLSVTVIEDVSAAVIFTGTRVSVYGSLRPPLQADTPLPLTKYSIPAWDYGGVPAMVPYQAPNVTTPQNDVNFFTSDVLPFGTYTLTINVTTASSSAPFYLDYIAVEVPGSAPSASSFSSSMQSTASSTATSLPVAAVTPQPHRPMGAIVGGVLAGVLGIVGAFFVFFCYFRQRHRAAMPPEYNYGKCAAAQKDVPPHAVPFTDPERGASMAQPDDFGLMFVPGRSSMGSQPSSSSRPDSLPPSAAYYYPLVATPPVFGNMADTAPYRSHFSHSGAMSSSPSNCPGTRILTQGKRVLSVASGETVDSTSVASSGVLVDVVFPGISTNRVEEIPEDDELPPVYSRTPLPRENCAESVSEGTGSNLTTVDGGITVSRCGEGNDRVNSEKR